MLHGACVPKLERFFFCKLYMFRVPLAACVCALCLATPAAAGDDSEAAQGAALAVINKNLDLLSSKLEKLTVSSRVRQTAFPLDGHSGLRLSTSLLQGILPHHSSIQRPL